jgi:hypothetical protein
LEYGLLLTQDLTEIDFQRPFGEERKQVSETRQKYATKAYRERSRWTFKTRRGGLSTQRRNFLHFLGSGAIDKVKRESHNACGETF